MASSAAAVRGMVPSGLPIASLGPDSTNPSPIGVTDANNARSLSSGSTRWPASSYPRTGIRAAGPDGGEEGDEDGGVEGVAIGEQAGAASAGGGATSPPASTGADACARAEAGLARISASRIGRARVTGEVVRWVRRHLLIA